jgi:ferrous iron transport protein B
MATSEASAPRDPRQPAPSETEWAAARVALMGNPNTGKTTVFNRLCGARAKTSNFPGTTTSARVGRGRLHAYREVEVFDLPGLYQLTMDVHEARLVRGILDGEQGHPPDAILVTVDAGNLARNLVLVGELLAREPRPVVCLNMIDLAARRGVTVDAAELSRRLGVPVVPMIASRGEGFDTLRAELAAAVGGSVVRARPAGTPGRGTPHDALTAWARQIAEAVTTVNATAGPGVDGITDWWDRVLTHPVLGLGVFLAVMGGLFYALFALGQLPSDLIEATFAWLGGFVATVTPPGAIRDLLANGVVGGIAGTVVFLPQICFLFFFISLLEDTGYLARAAFVMDRFLRPFGLPGHAFVPLLTSHACALPGIMSARLIPDRRDRLATILVAPFMSCSARLPVFLLLTGLLFSDRPALAVAAFAGCYFLGAGAAFLSAALFGRTILRGEARPIILELPPYQVPSLSNALYTVRDQGLAFLQTAGTVIMAICVVMWWLSAYPKADPPAEATALRARASAAGVTSDEAASLANAASELEGRAQQAQSFAGRIGRTMQPVFAPLGFDWQLTVGIVTSFIAREVFVSTMAVLAGGRDAVPAGGAAAGDGDDEGVFAKIRGMTRDDGTPVFTRATAASALVFFVLAMQCLPTLAVTRRETGHVRYALLQFGYMSAVAYVAGFIVYQALVAAGVS